ncbi:MAG TPA: DUF4363 family protein [Clostridia bacterium]|jgi:hypothetical protein|nr:DUF4363 family protein [Clostridia bacterium]
MKMRKIIFYTVPILILSFFIFIMNSGGYYKRPRGEIDNVPKYIEAVKKDLLEEEWDGALKNAEKLELAWDKVVQRIQFSVEREEINAINAGLARLLGFIEGRDKGGALAEINEIGEHWRDLEK